MALQRVLEHELLRWAAPTEQRLTIPEPVTHVPDPQPKTQVGKARERMLLTQKRLRKAEKTQDLM